MYQTITDKGEIYLLTEEFSFSAEFFSEINYKIRIKDNQLHLFLFIPPQLELYSVNNPDENVADIRLLIHFIQYKFSTGNESISDSIVAELEQHLLSTRPDAWLFDAQ